MKKTYRVPEKLIGKVQRDMKEQGIISENEYVLQAMQHFLECKKADVTQSMKLIVLKYDGKCLKCNNKVAAGNWAYYGRGVGIVCLDCSVLKGHGDKALVAKYLKSREFAHLIKSLRSEADRLADKVEIFTMGDKLASWKKKSLEVKELVFKYLTELQGTDRERQVLEEIARQSKREDELLRDIESFFERHIKIKKWKKKIHV